MICSLSTDQKKIALQIVNKVVAADYTISPQTILKNVYSVVFEEYLKKDLQKHAKEYAFASTQFVAGTLHLLVQADTVRKMFSELANTQEQFAKENIEKFEKKEELEKLLGINVGEIKNIPSTVTKEQVKPSLEKIASSFPQVSEMVKYGTSAGTPMTWDFPVLKNSDGTNVRLIRVTEFLKGAFAKSKDNSGTISTRRGDLADIVVRKFFSNPAEYDKFKENILQDKEFTDLFRRFSENTIPTKALPSPVVSRYMTEFVNDMMYAINYIQTNYQDAYLTDLRSLVDNSNLSSQQKSNFYLYSKELGMRGELDLLAIYPDGTFKVIDIKTSDGNIDTKEKIKYGRQASIYDLMISRATGLKSKGENDIIYLTAGISNTATILGKKDNGNLRLTISAYTRVTNKNQNPEMLVKEIELYREKIESLYNRIIPTVKNNQAINPLNPMLTSWYNKNIPNKDKKSLEMIFSSNDELASHEDLLNGKAWLEERFPELVGKIHIIRTMNSISGAQFFLNSIKFYEKVNKGADYHEGWHAFSQLYLTKDEKKILYKSIQQQAIDFTTRDGRTLNTQSADYLDIEEFLAEEFRKYAQSPSTYSPMKGNPKTKSLFRKILDALKSIYDWFTNNGTTSYLEMFEQLYTNTFNRSNYSTDNAIFTHLNSLFIDSTSNNSVIDNMTFREFRDFSDFNLTQYLSKNNIVISDLLTLKGIETLNKIIRNSLINQRDAIAAMREDMNIAIQETEDEVVINNLKANEENLKYYSNLLDFILEQNANGDYVRFADFMRAYFKFSQYRSLRNLFDKNQNRISRIVDEESLTEFMQREEEGENDTSDEDTRPDSQEAPDLDYNNPGNLKQAIEFARDELKDFFNGIPRLVSSDLNEEQYEMNAGGLPLTLSREEGFYKTLNILQGSPTLSVMILRLNSQNSYMLFPELRTVRERLLGDEEKEIKGLIPKFQELSKILSSGEATAEDIEQHGRLMSFLMHFTHVMSLRKVPFDTFIRRMNFSPENENPYMQSPIQTRENLESIINSILNDFTKGFQINTEKRFKEAKTHYVSIYEAMYRIFGQGEQGLTRFMMEFEGENPFIYDHIGRRFYFNAFYVHKNFTTNNPNKEQLKDFFSHLGITINDKAYENPNHLDEIKSIYNRMRDILFTYHKRTGEQILRMYSTNLPTLVKEWKDANDYANSDLDGVQKIIAMNTLRSKEEEIQSFARRLFSSSPVTKMLFDGKDRNLLKDPKYKVFAAYLPLFQQLARIEKNYHKRFSSGSMIVIDKLQFSHFLPNNMLVTEMLINEQVNSFADFAKFPALSHLDPIKNPQILNSWIFSRIFSQAGTKVPNMRLGVSVISQISDIYDDDVQSKRVQDLSAEEKILMDAIMLKSDGSSEMRRMETSNTAWRLSLNQLDGVERKFVKAINIERDGFANPTFLSQIRNYIQHAAWKYQYYQNENNAKRDANHANKGLDKLGVFDEMIPQSKEKLKKFIREKGGDMNTLMLRLEKADEELFNQINKEIVEYFEAVTLTNEDSYKNVFNNSLSEKSKNILYNLASINSVRNPFYMKLKTTGELTEGVFRDIIANDFIMTMEDSLLFFGDYTYYKDPIKRRKIIANNGSINMVDDIMAEAMAAQTSARSLKDVFQRAKGITTQKDYRLVKKVVMSDIKMESNSLKNDKMLKDLLLLRQQKFSGEKSNITLEQIRNEKKNIISAFSEMQVADAGAYLNLDTNRFMRMREMVWDWDKDEKEYIRQIILLKQSLGYELGEDEKEHIQNGKNQDGSYSSFNVSKYALTGPIYYDENAPLVPSFDKMGLRVLLPEFDWNRITRPLFEKMYGGDIDYMVMDTGSKAFTPPIENVFSSDGLSSTIDSKKALHSTYHAGGFFKFQQNTTHVNDRSTFAVQLRSIFYEGLLAQQKYGAISTSLLNSWKKVVRSLGDYIRINSSRSLTDMGLDINGKMRDKATFAKYLRERMLEIGDVDEKVLDLLNSDKNGDFSTFLEALPFQKNMVDLIAGIVDDNFRKVKLNGTKFYQSFEMGSSQEIKRGKEEDLPLEYKGTIELKWHGLKIIDGKVISTTPVESRISFRKQFYPLLNLNHPDGERINTLKRLNEAIRNEKWLDTYSDSITFIGVRIPLQDLNFSSHIIVREFLPEAFGDMILLPPEFYAQTGSDNDIDTVTASFRYLNSLGRIIKRPAEEYTDITRRIEELSTKISEEKAFTIAKSNDDTKERLEAVKKEFLENEVYALKNKTADDLERDLTIVEQDGYRTVAGFVDPKSTLFKLRKKGEFNDIVDIVSAIVVDLNKGRRISSPTLKELNEMEGKRDNYIKGVTNDIISSILQFMEAPENYDFLTETDSIQKIKDIAEENLSRKLGHPVELGRQLTSLEAMSYVTNITNHHNNFAIRSILGSLVRFRSMLPLMEMAGLSIQREYRAGPLNELLKRFDSGISIVEETRNPREKTYKRLIQTPLLYKKDTSKGIKISVFNEDGGRTTKDLSAQVSSLLDLFKNADIFPSIGITWLNVKPMIFLMAQGVPMERAILFLNNPVVQDIQRELDELGTDARPKHALVSAVQKYSADIFPPSDTNSGFPGWGKYRVKNEAPDGKKTINTMMFATGPAAQNYLGDKYLTFSEEGLKTFTKEYGEYMRTAPKYKRNMTEFLRVNPSYDTFAKDIAAYYGTLLADGDMFYLFFIKGLSRNSAKVNSLSAITYMNALKQARLISGMANPEFEEKIEKESMMSPFYNDSTIENMLSNAFPNILTNKNNHFVEQYKQMLQRIVWQTFGTPEDRRKVEMRVMSDFLYSTYLNFFIYKDGDNANRLYEYFEYDISPLLRPLVEDEKSMKNFFGKMSTMSEDDKVASLYSKSLLSSQLEVLTSKYPELNNIPLIQNILIKSEHGIDPMKDGVPDFKDVMNALPQNYVTFNLSPNPKDREAEETVIRNDFEKLVMFDIAQFPALEAKLKQDEKRLDVYKNAENIKEIRKIFNLLGYYLLTQSSHLERNKGSFSYLVPPIILKNVIETSIENFNRFLKEGASFKGGDTTDAASNEVIDKYLKGFEKMFKDMNPDLRWSNPVIINTEIPSLPDETSEQFGVHETDLPQRKKKDRPGLPYQKAHTGKLYSKLGNMNIAHFIARLAKEQDVTLQGKNDFRIEDKNTEIDPLNCKIE